MNISLIISTYNWKEALALVLKSAFAQTIAPNEIIIADDGSTDETDQMIAALKPLSQVPLIHIFQENHGFRAAAIRNKAIATAHGDYIVLVDGDMILERHFIADHIRAARSGWFIQGSRVRINSSTTDDMLKSDRIRRIVFFSKGIKNRKNSLRSTLLSALTSLEIKHASGINL